MPGDFDLGVPGCAGGLLVGGGRGAQVAPGLQETMRAAARGTPSWPGPGAQDGEGQRKMRRLRDPATREQLAAVRNELVQDQEGPYGEEA